MSKRLSKPFIDAAAKPGKPRPKRRRPSSLSIRVTDEERATLKRKAGKRSVGAYVREMALGVEQTQRRKMVAKPSIDYAMLGQVLGKLGQSEQVACLFLLLAATENQRVSMKSEDRAALREVCADVRDMRTRLVEALGLKSGGAK